MGVRFACHACSKRLNIKTELAGRRGICPSCAVRFRIPTHDTETSTPVSGQDALDDSGSSDSVFTDEGKTAVGRTNGAATATAARPSATTQTTATTNTPRPESNLSPQHALPQPSDPGPTLEQVLGGGQATWYVRPPSGGQYGPADGPTLGQWIQEGRVSETAMIWRDGWPDWRNAKQVLPIFGTHAARVAPPQPAPQQPAPQQPAPQLPAAQSATDSLQSPRPDGAAIAPADATESSLHVRPGAKVLDSNKKKVSRKRVAVSIMLGCIAVVLAVALFLVLQNPS